MLCLGLTSEREGDGVVIRGIIFEVDSPISDGHIEIATKGGVNVRLNQISSSLYLKSWCHASIFHGEPMSKDDVLQVVPSFVVGWSKERAMGVSIYA